LREFLRKDDLGDTARRLGQRVSERLDALAREASSQVPAFATSHPAAGDPRADASGTQTFAAHEVLREWTARLDSSPPRFSRTAPLGAELESGMTAPSPSRAPPRAAGRRRLGWALVSMLAALGVVLAALRGQHMMGAQVAAAAPARVGEVAPGGEQPERQQPGLAADGNGPRDATPFSSAPVAASIAPPFPSSPPAPSSPSAPPVRAPVAAKISSASTAAREAARAARTPAPVAHAARLVARLQLTAEPAAWVEVDAARVGRTPLMSHGTSPGRHTVAFINQLLGERIEAIVTLEPSQLTAVHADFTSANPRVYVR
jgi:hypothetical protein